MLKLLKINTTLLFFILFIPWILTSIDYELSQIINIVAYTIILIWFLGLDAELMKKIPLKIRPSNTMFLINSIFIYLGICVLVIFVEPGKNFTASGLIALPFFYFFYAIFSVYTHLSKLLTYAEEEKEIPLNKRFGDMVLFFFFFIGVWWLQPRIRKVLEKPEITSDSYSVKREL